MGSTGAEDVLAIVASGLFGLAVGSFLNVVAYRLPRHISVAHPPSHCPSCGTTLVALDLVPVASWVALRGRCRHCQAAVSPRYPIVEGVTGAAFAGVAAAVGAVDPLVPLLVVTACAMAAVLIDREGLPVAGPVAAGAALVALALVVMAAVTGEPARIAWAALGAALALASVATADLEGGRRSAPARPTVTTRLAAVSPLVGRWVVLAALAWAAGWLWPGAAPITACWTCVAVVARRLGSAARPASSTTWPLPLAVLVVGAFAAVLVGGAVGRP